MDRGAKVGVLEAGRGLEQPSRVQGFVTGLKMFMPVCNTCRQECVCMQYAHCMLAMHPLIPPSLPGDFFGQSLNTGHVQKACLCRTRNAVHLRDLLARRLTGMRVPASMPQLAIDGSTLSLD